MNIQDEQNLKWVVLICGIGAALVDATLNVEAMMSSNAGLGMLAGVIVLTIWNNTTPAAATHIWRRSHFGKLIAVAIALAVSLTLAVSFIISLERVSDARDGKTATEKTRSVASLIASEKLAKARAALMTGDKLTIAECSTGIGKKCLSWRNEELPRLRAEVIAAEKELKRVGIAKPAQSVERRVSNMFGVKVADVDMWWPAFFPLSMLVIGVIAITYGLSPITLVKRKEQPRNLTKKQQAERWWFASIEADGRKPLQKHLASHFGVTPSCASKWVASWEQKRSRELVE